jgi:hypothetical protein
VVAPEATADVVVDNTDLARPRVITWPGRYPAVSTPERERRAARPGA